jgi:hypothetical protein
MSSICIAAAQLRLGFVHQVLTYTRERSGSLVDVGRRLNTNVDPPPARQ